MRIPAVQTLSPRSSKVWAFCLKRTSDAAGAEEPNHRHRGCCARTASGHAAAAPLRSVMNSRRFIAAPEAQPGASYWFKQARWKGITVNASTMSALGHVWTAPWQELSDVAAALVGCGHVSGLFVRRIWPLALMLCADRLPIESTHFKVR